MKKQWIASWKERGVAGSTKDKRLVLLMEDYDYVLTFEELNDNKYSELGRFKVPSNTSGNNIKLINGFFHKAQTLKTKTYAGKDKAPEPVLIDLMMPIFEQGGVVNALRLYSVNKDDGTGKLKRETVLAVYKFNSYETYKEINNKFPEKGMLKSIPSEYVVCGIKFNPLPITNGSFVYNDVATIDSIAATLDALEAAKVYEVLHKHYVAMATDDGSSAVQSTSSAAPAPAPAAEVPKANTDDLEDDEFPF